MTAGMVRLPEGSFVYVRFKESASFTETCHRAREGRYPMTDRSSHFPLACGQWPVFSVQCSRSLIPASAVVASQ